MHQDLINALVVINAELEEFKENDPVAFQARLAEVKRMREELRRWEDNLDALEDWCVRKMGIERAVFHKMLQSKDAEE